MLGCSKWERLLAVDVHVCVCVRERERDKQRARERHEERERELGHGSEDMGGAWLSQAGASPFGCRQPTNHKPSAGHSSATFVLIPPIWQDQTGGFKPFEIARSPT